MLPNDPVMLLSYVNTKLRDSYKNLDDMCEDLDADKADIEERLQTIGYKYSVDTNQFI